jgi:protein-disulfide isomerase
MKSSGQFTMESLTDTAKEAGISEADFKKAMQDPALDKELERTKAIAQALNVSGTPVLIIGNQLVPGAIDMTMLKQKVEKARKDAAKG